MTERAHYAMCMFAEGATGISEIDDARVKLILVPRGVGKTSLITGGLPLMNLLRYDDWSVGIANEKADNAEAFLAAIKLEFETNTLLRTLFPERVPDDFKSTTWKSDRIVIKRRKPNPVSPSVLATGTGGTVTGVHVAEWWIDDIISQDAAEAAYRGNFAEIEKVNRWLVRLEPLLRFPKEDRIGIVGTCWWQGDCYDFAQEHWGHGEEPKHFIWTLKLPSGEVQHLNVFRRGEIAVFRRPIYENGTSWYPERLPDQHLELLKQQDPVFFAGQYLLAPAAGGASLFEENWLRFYEREGPGVYFRNADGETEHVQFRDMACAISVDPAFADSHSAARTAIPVVGIHRGRKFLLEDFAQQGLNVDAIAHVAVDFCLRYRPHKLFVETIVAQVAVADAIRRVAHERGVSIPVIDEIRSHGREKKEWRIYGLEPYFKRGEFHVHRSHSNFLTEYNGFPRIVFRDLLDALAFQRDWWERAALLDGRGSSNAIVEANRRTLSRLRAGWA